MSTLGDTINATLRTIGPGSMHHLRAVMAEFGGLSFTDEGRLSVLAATIAAAASTHHARHRVIYLEAVKTWSLEVASELMPAPLRVHEEGITGPIEDGADILISGLNGLIDRLVGEGVAVQDRLVTELAFIARLLGQHDANAIHCTLRHVHRALACPDYRPGDAVRVPLREQIHPLTREARLEAVEPRGVA
ncbi:MAG TPA: hypothetical protein VKT70_11915 [Stellaceae bacterium]|nr:hypothetical protein [Stellaceae bacterium]